MFSDIPNKIKLSVLPYVINNTLQHESKTIYKIMFQVYFNPILRFCLKILFSVYWP